MLEVLRQAAAGGLAGGALLTAPADRNAPIPLPRIGAGGEVRLARDYFHDLVRDSQPHPGLSAERERWLRRCRVEGREERLFEFEMLLRGMERYFKLHNLPIDSMARPVVTRDFSDELRDVRDALGQAIKLARRLLDPGEDQRMMFRRYVQDQLVDDRARRALLDDELEEDTPQESLFLLRQSFESLRTVVDSLLEARDGELPGLPRGGKPRPPGHPPQPVLPPLPPARVLPRVRPGEVRPGARCAAEARRPRAAALHHRVPRAVPAAPLSGLRARHDAWGGAAGAGGARAGPERGDDAPGLPAHRARAAGGAAAAPGRRAQGVPRPLARWRTRSAGVSARSRTTRSGCSTSAPVAPSS